MTVRNAPVCCIFGAKAAGDRGGLIVVRQRTNNHVTDLGVAVASAAIGSLATLAWEAFLAPRIAARSLAELLAADMSFHMQTLLTEVVQRRDYPKTLPYPHPSPLRVFDALGSRLGELPEGLLRQTLNVYRTLDRLGTMAARANEAHARLLATSESDPAYRFTKERLEREMASYALFSEQLLTELNKLQVPLLALARPRWSPRFWLAPRPKVLTEEEVREKWKAGAEEHRARRRQLDDTSGAV